MTSVKEWFWIWPIVSSIIVMLVIAVTVIVSSSIIITIAIDFTIAIAIIDTLPCRPMPLLVHFDHPTGRGHGAWLDKMSGLRLREQPCDMFPAGDPPEGISFSNEVIWTIQNTLTQHTNLLDGCFEPLVLIRGFCENRIYCNCPTWSDQQVVRRFAETTNRV